jgi:hypothetical protein
MTTIVKVEDAAEEEYTEVAIADFTGPSIEEFFDENPCLLEIGPLSFNKLVYGDLPLGEYYRELTEKEGDHCRELLAARLEVANNFMKFFNIKHKK